jgi:hypothetical protein
LKIHYEKMSGNAFPRALKMFGGIMASCSLLILTQMAAEAASFSGDSTTILRVRETTQEGTLIPLYEYLHLAGTGSVKDGSLSLFVGGWGRGDFVERSGINNNDGDLQYGYLSYRGNKNNLQFNAGRQFITEGVATERVDGLYLRSDLAAGFQAALFVGTPVTTEPRRLGSNLVGQGPLGFPGPAPGSQNFAGGNLIYGGRIAQSMPKLYTIGVSALKMNEGGVRLREEEAVDFWLYPTKQIDITGRSSYNSLSDGWMEHAYTASITPMDKLRISANFSKVNYRDYFYHVTSSAFGFANGIIDPNEEVLTLGGSIGFTFPKNFGISAEYKHYDYDLAGKANYYGASATFFTPDAFSAGLSYHRMDGDTSALQYDRYRAYASQKFGKADVTVDFVDVAYDSNINGRDNTISVSAAAGYEFMDHVRLAGDLEYLRSSDFDNELRGLVKVTFAFDSERRAKSEK